MASYFMCICVCISICFCVLRLFLSICIVLVKRSRGVAQLWTKRATAGPNICSNQLALERSHQIVAVAEHGTGALAQWQWQNIAQWHGGTVACWYGYGGRVVWWHGCMVYGGVWRCKLLLALHRAEMTDLDPIFCRWYFLCI